MEEGGYSTVSPDFMKWAEKKKKSRAVLRTCMNTFIPLDSNFALRYHRSSSSYFALLNGSIMVEGSEVGCRGFGGLGFPGERVTSLHQDAQSMQVLPL